MLAYVLAALCICAPNHRPPSTQRPRAPTETLPTAGLWAAVHPHQVSARQSSHIQLRLVQDGDARNQLVPLAQLRSTQPGPPLELTLAAAASPAALHLQVEVTDSDHLNEQSGFSIWDGDGLQLALHAVRPEDAATEVVGEAMAPGDLDLAFGLGRRGPEAVILHRGADEGAAAFPAPFFVVRDETRKRTTYTIEVPWQLLHTTALTTPALGIGLQLNDTDANGEKRHLVWGMSRAGGFRPSCLERVVIMPGAVKNPALHLREAAYFGEHGPHAKLDLLLPPAGHNASQTTTLQLQCGGLQRTLAIKARPDAMERAVIDIAAQPNPKGHGGPGVLPPCQAQLRGPAQTTLQAPIALPLVDHEQTLRQVDRRLSLVRAQAHAHAHPLASRHVGHLAAMWQLLRSDAQAAKDTQPQLSWDLLVLAQGLGEQLHLIETKGLSALEGELAHGRLPMLELLRSGIDGSWQPYVVQLPHKVQGEPPPAVLFLHGKASPSLARFLAKVLAPDPHDLGGFAWVVPWARGNSSVIAAAEEDVVDMLDLLVTQNRIDAERIFALGFSMGATGAFNLTMHRPERFAAVGLISGGAWEVALGHGLGHNVRGVPFYIWHGRKDSVVPPSQSERIVEELRAAHVPFEAHFSAQDAHTFLPQVREQALHFFAAHRRAPQTHWRYTADGPHHRARSGIAMHYDAEKSSYPSISVRLEPTSGRVELTSEGTDGLEVDLPLLLGPQATACELLLNGVPAYRGPPIHLMLGAGAPRP